MYEQYNRKGEKEYDESRADAAGYPEPPESPVERSRRVVDEDTYLQRRDETVSQDTSRDGEEDTEAHHEMFFYIHLSVSVLR